MHDQFIKGDQYINGIKGWLIYKGHDQFIKQSIYKGHDQFINGIKGWLIYKGQNQFIKCMNNLKQSTWKSLKSSCLFVCKIGVLILYYSRQLRFHQLPELWISAQASPASDINTPLHIFRQHHRWLPGHFDWRHHRTDTLSWLVFNVSARKQILSNLY